uniref:Kinesin motor domain-containing protein n=1 Tax=Steinernema glaseri TaxID=37863 RepID=A0A1I8AVD0_9BILA
MPPSGATKTADTRITIRIEPLSRHPAESTLFTHNAISANPTTCRAPLYICAPPPQQRTQQPSSAAPLSVQVHARRRMSHH